MKSERERAGKETLYTLTCDYCGEKSAEFELNKTPEKWIEREVSIALETLLEDNPGYLESGVEGGTYICHFDSEEHLELWEKYHTVHPFELRQLREEHRRANPHEAPWLNNKVYFAINIWYLNAMERMRR